ncbi:MAG: T9SS type A sorting domain-containing protein [Chitinophagaceae bacterium]|nr:MAG: T9SS type A sorting domain-containing protein [Chitinophagaceae bacterium]
MKKITMSALLALASLGASAQFTQNFEGGTTMPAGWTTINQGDANGWVVTSVDEDAHSGTNVASIHYDFATAHEDYLITPAITVTAGLTDRLTFWIKSASEFYLEPYEVRLSTTNNSAPASFSVVLQPSSEAAVEWTKKSFDLTNYVGQTVYISVRATGVNELDLFVDDVVSDAVPSCAAVTGLTADNVSTDSATISWTSTAGAFQYFLGDASDLAPVAAEAVTAGASPFTISDLDPATTYKIWIRSVCGDEFGDWTEALTILTSCVPVTVPTVVEGAESTENGEIPVCWSSTLVSGDNNWEVTTPLFGDITTTASGDKIIFKNYQTSEALLFSPAMDYTTVTADTRVNVFLHRHASADASDKYVIYANTTPSITGATLLLERFSKTTTAPTVAATGFYNEKIAIPASFNGQATVYIIVRGVTSAGSSSYALGIDDFKVEFVPTCAEVSDVVIGDVGGTEADFSWTASPSAPANGYEYAYSTSNVSPDNAELTGTVGPGVTEATITDLEPVTTYYVWVRSVCSSEELSPWSIAVSFTTGCLPVAESALPWTEGFEGLAQTGASIFPSCWSVENGDWSTTTNDNTTNDIDARTGTKFARIAWNATNEFLWTPGFELTAGVSYDFGFWFAGFGDFSTWSGNIVVNSTQVSTGSTVLGAPFINSGTAPANTYTKATRSFIPAESGVYYFGLQINEPTFAPWYISFDDFEVLPTSLSVGEFSTGNLDFYPNPVKDRLNLSYSETINSVSVTNVLGQQVLSQQANASEINVDMSGLTPGTYFVRVASANAQKTIKVIKQ